ncbi:MAG: AmmeMemoRadiSam system protein B [Planctomycetota bacterium]
MDIRDSCRAGSFYPASPSEIREFLAEWRARDPGVASHPAPLGGLVPHAGWTYSGYVAYLLFARLGRVAGSLKRLVLLGAVHVPGVLRASLGDWDAWGTPLGRLPVDREFEQRLLNRSACCRSPGAHLGEHSIEVQLPIIVDTLGDLPIVPIAVPPSSEWRGLGRVLAEAAAGPVPSTAIIASSDLTHYGAHFYGWAPAGTGEPAVEFATGNDRRFLDRVRGLDPEGALHEARVNRNACGSGAVAAAIEACKGLGAARGELLAHTNSLRPGEHAESFVGYAAVAFV